MWKRIKYDTKYIILNCVINKVPSWYIRKLFYRILGLSIGKNSRIGIKTVILNPENIVIGANTIINEYCHLDGRGGLNIGDNVSISIYTKIITASHKMNSEKFEYYCEKTIIGNRVWIGTSAIILNGSNISDNCVIGAGCVFKGSTVPSGVYIGNPAKLKKYRKLEGLYTLKYNAYFR